MSPLRLLHSTDEICGSTLIRDTIAALLSSLRVLSAEPGRRFVGIVAAVSATSDPREKHGESEMNSSRAPNAIGRGDAVVGSYDRLASEVDVLIPRG